MKDETEEVNIGVLDGLGGKKVMLLKAHSSVVLFGEILFCVGHLFHREILDNEI